VVAFVDDRVAFFMPMIHWAFRGRANLRNHRKMIICDNQTAIIGGMNLASEYMGPQHSIGRWQDLSLLVEGPLADHLTEIFRSDWKFASKEAIGHHSANTPELKSDTNGVTQLLASGPDVRNDSLRNAILTSIFRAQRRIWIMTPYFVPDELAIVGSANMDMRSLLLNYEIALSIYNSEAIRRLEVWMLRLKTDCSSRKLQPKSSFGLIESVGRLFAPLL
jgi:phosphatidylserine/phosphatidylglycerophosphate/cardiolipin synthase-like enzyme